MVQKRKLKTREKLLDAARAVIAEVGYAELRVEEVVKRAGVAKGTFFSHFDHKDSMMDVLIGAGINAELDRIEKLPPPASISEMVAHLMPLMRFMSSERYVLDVILRYSGATARDVIGPIALTFPRHDEVVAAWIADGPFRKDQPPNILADGVQAFMFQVMALNFCAINSQIAMATRLETYLSAWLQPKVTADHMAGTGAQVPAA